MTKICSFCGKSSCKDKALCITKGLILTTYINAFGGAKEAWRVFALEHNGVINLDRDAKEYLKKLKGVK